MWLVSRVAAESLLFRSHSSGFATEMEDATLYTADALRAVKLQLSESALYA